MDEEGRDVSEKSTMWNSKEVVVWESVPLVPVTVTV
jgi:hypothetical protein